MPVQVRWVAGALDADAGGVSVSIGLFFLHALKQFYQSKIEDLTAAIAGQEDVARLDVAMDDPLLVSGPQTIAHLNTNVQQLIDWKSFAFCHSREAVAERLSFQQLHNDEGLTLMFPKFVNVADVGMVERRRRPRLTAETLQRLWITAHLFG